MVPLKTTLNIPMKEMNDLQALIYLLMEAQNCLIAETPDDCNLMLSNFFDRAKAYQIEFPADSLYLEIEPVGALLSINGTNVDGAKIRLFEATCFERLYHVFVVISTTGDKHEFVKFAHKLPHEAP